ncbi:transcriptional regulator opi1 [Marasmius crinis-equi]|uniref:Transcriptional regulator opi1 n=1 Tax=Marasmius crinis-equi TaxID=585013 RepID=A0ABR3F7S3_9AGAR
MCPLGGRPLRSPLSPRSPEVHRRYFEAQERHGKDDPDPHDESPMSRLSYDPAPGVGSWLSGTSPPHRTRSGMGSDYQEANPSTSRSITSTAGDFVPHGEYRGHSSTGTSSSIASSISPVRRRRRSPSPTRHGGSPHSPSERGSPQSQTQLAARGRWQVLLAQAGGLGAAFSAESMKRLRYCLSWLLWAIDRIDSHITFLRDFTLSMQQQPLGAVQEEGHGISPTTPTQASANRTSRRQHTRTPSASISEANQRQLNDVRKDVVHTVRQVVSVVSKYAGESSLPDVARDRVKGLILMLPKKWAEAVKVGGPVASGSGATATGGPGGTERDSSTLGPAAGRAVSDRRHRVRERGLSSTGVSPASSRAASPAASPRVSIRGLTHEGGNIGVTNDGSRAMSANSAVATAQKVLALATESLDMMKNVTGVLKDSLDAADAWVAALRLQRDRGAGDDILMDDVLPSPPPPQDESRSSSALGDYRLFQFQEYRERDRLSPLHSRRGSITEGPPLPLSGPPDSPYSTHSTLAGTGSVPGTPGNSGIPYKYLDAPSPDVRGSMRTMSLTDEDLKVKREDENGNLMEGTEMDVDVDR